MDEDKRYLAARKFCFWLFSFIFIFFTPVLIYYSLGYKFDLGSKKFLKTGIISIKTFPAGAEVYLDEKKLSESSPCTLREVIPKEYTVSLKSGGFYDYKIPIQVKPSLVFQIDVVLVPKVRDVEKLKFDFNIYKSFFIRHFFGEKILVFSDKGIYLLDRDFKNTEKLSSCDIGETAASTITDIIQEGNNKLVFWSQMNVWALDMNPKDDLGGQENMPAVIYKAEEYIKYVFFGLRERYLLIQDGLKVIAVDMENPKVYFSILELKSLNSKIFYESRSETLYIQDKVAQTNTFSLFKIELIPFLGKKKDNEPD